MISGTCFCNAVKYELTAESQMQGSAIALTCQVVGAARTGPRMRWRQRTSTLWPAR